MHIVRPITITDAILKATDVPETDYAAWSSGTTYAVGNRVILTSTHKIYESLQAANLNHDPAASPTWWAEVSATNRWKPFDTVNSTRAEQITSMSFTLTPGQVVNTVAALNVAANSVRIRMVDAIEGTVYDETISLTTGLPSPDWYQYFFADVPLRDYALKTDLPAYAGADVIIDFATSVGDTCACGVLILGCKAPLGLGAEYGASLGIVDYSRKEVNEWGDTVLVQRAYARRTEFPMTILNIDLDVAMNILTSIRAMPVLWIGAEGYSSLVLFGWFKDFNINVAYATASDCTIQIEGLT